MKTLFAIGVGVSLFATHAVAFAQGTDADDVELEVQAAPPSPSSPGAADAGVTVTQSPDTAAAEEAARTRQAVADLERRLAEVERREARASAAETRARELEEQRERARQREERVRQQEAQARWWEDIDLAFTGYVQTQYERSQLSEDQLQQGGTPFNQDRFSVRRARFRAEARTKHAGLALELDANTTRGAFVGVRRAEAFLLYPQASADLPPYVQVNAGLTEIPFGFELTYSHRRRVFMERTTGSLAFFRGEPDVGVRVHGGVGPFRYAAAIMNGVPLDDRPGAASVDPNGAPDILGRVGVETQPLEHTEVSGGVSFLTGRGFHPGTDATKDGVQWRDLNENETIDTGELSPVPGRAATPSKNFDHWAVGADLQLGLSTPIGWSRLYGEVTLATNLDRSLFIADPVAASQDFRELAWYIAFVQEITPYALAGGRIDYYDPDADFLDDRRGNLVPADASILTVSPVVGAVLPGRARLVFQYDFVVDSSARDTRGVPTDLSNDHWTIRLQVEH